ncbi:MAG: hypothetical protein K6D38_11865 [Pseudobutyrivibrio sp.]|nr:hypothetical protein [Pseudobutyrivibrio sp.]
MSIFKRGNDGQLYFSLPKYAVILNKLQNNVRYGPRTPVDPNRLKTFLETVRPKQIKELTIDYFREKPNANYEYWQRWITSINEMCEYFDFKNNPISQLEDEYFDRPEYSLAERICSGICYEASVNLIFVDETPSLNYTEKPVSDSEDELGLFQPARLNTNYPAPTSSTRGAINIPRTNSNSSLARNM